jgi:hypothetical protein
MNRLLNHYRQPIGAVHQRPHWIAPTALVGSLMTGWLANKLGVFPPAWLLILTVLGLVVAGSVWATRPADVGLGRHIAALIGQIVLDVLRTVLRAVVAAVVVLALLVAGWSFAATRIQARRPGPTVRHQRPRHQPHLPDPRPRPPGPAAGGRTGRRSATRGCAAAGVRTRMGRRDGTDAP